ncbi:Plastid-lipid associated protein PAP / fibrillin family protein [Thalictrum thalictroides]|uniref:Plastid-lipid associated protein PAP / fibrillin family protein n=1 Tax=Thalictrum thalictroides TaxID=46969 RepID=A0A7J6VMI9_THATH|nr:Plastid-lipid associated protein PAP / fibrillin family protein [Thalictrum thalictroides]
MTLFLNKRSGYYEMLWGWGAKPFDNHKNYEPATLLRLVRSFFFFFNYVKFELQFFSLHSSSSSMATSSLLSLSTFTPIRYSSSSSSFSSTSSLFPLSSLHPHSSSTIKTNELSLNTTFTRTLSNEKWRTRVSFFPSFFKTGKKDVKTLKQELLDAISQLDRGADATPEDQQRIDKMARELEAVNSIKEPLKSDLLNGKWELIYTTSVSILQTQRPKFLRSKVNYQAINLDTLRAQNMESSPFFNQVTADLTPLNARRVAVKFDYFKILGLIPVKAPERATGELEITYLDEDLRISRGDKGNLFILQMVDPSYRVPV